MKRRIVVAFVLLAATVMLPAETIPDFTALAAAFQGFTNSAASETTPADMVLTASAQHPGWTLQVFGGTSLELWVLRTVARPATAACSHLRPDSVRACGLPPPCGTPLMGTPA